MHYTLADIEALSRIPKINLINSISGIKPANLIGTKSEGGQSNLAIFSSVVHLGSTPPLLGCITRPDEEVRRHALENIKATGQYTINAVPVAMTQQAHYTSAKFGDDQSEFEYCQFTEEYLDGWQAPFVKESPLKMGLALREIIPIALNGTMLIIGEVQHLIVDDSGIQEDNQIDLAQLGIAGISGLNSYYGLDKIGDYPYARVRELPDFSGD